nr:MAG TPA: hypothetical protein [Caudoviricetes sp.]
MERKVPSPLLIKKIIARGLLRVISSLIKPEKMRFLEMKLAKREGNI